MQLGSSGGERLGGGVPAVQALTCSLASGLLYFTLSYARSQAIPWDATLADFALALENLATVAHVEVLARPRAALAGFESPQRICSGEGNAAAPVVVEVTFVDSAGVVPPLSLEQPSLLPGRPKPRSPIAAVAPRRSRPSPPPRPPRGNSPGGCGARRRD